MATLSLAGLKTQLKSTRYLTELRKRAASFRDRGYAISPKLVAPDSIRWWYFLEFGTGIRGEVGYASGHTYDIRAVDAKALSFMIDGEAHFSKHVVAPGIRPRAFVRKVMPKIHEVTANLVLSALINGKFRFSEVQSIVQENVIPAAKELIVASLAQEAPGTNPNGRLGGSTAAAVFEDEVKITTD